MEKGIYATTSAGVAAAVEQMIQDEAMRQVMLSALAYEIRARASTRTNPIVTRPTLSRLHFTEIAATEK